jgi:hypothetical protein
MASAPTWFSSYRMEIETQSLEHTLTMAPYPNS